MISIEKFLQYVRENAARINAYESGHDGSDGKSDCIGLIIGALRLLGQKWPWTHGSNYTARNKVDNLRPVSSASDLRLGELVFKVREPGDEKYALPSAYDGHPDRRDYYHVGVVTSLAPLEITHSTSVAGGIKRDTSLGQWRWAGELSLVDYDAEESEIPDDDVLYQAIVRADNEYPVKMRTGPSTNNKVKASVPQGTIVDVLDELDGWAKIRLDGQTGYMMIKFLSHQLEDDSLPENTEGYIEVPRLKLLEIKACLSDALGIIEQALDGKG